MPEYVSEYEREVRDTIVKSGLTGVAATVLAVAAFSPAGFGGMIGTSVASGFGADTANVAEDPYANLPPFPAPLSSQEVSDIRGQLAATAASLESARAATEDKIEEMRRLTVSPAVIDAAPTIAVHAPVVSYAPLTEDAVVAHDGGEPAYRDRHQEFTSLLLDNSL
jgi:hypothetical protein